VSAGATPALTVTGLSVSLDSGEAIIEDVDLRLEAGEILGIVGESGSGKTTTALALLGYNSAGTTIRGGMLSLAGRTLPLGELIRPLRGVLVSYVPQDPGRALNPSLRIAGAIEDVLRTHRRSWSQDDGSALRLLERVGLPGTRQFGRRFPHQLSGGQQQRVCIAASLSCDPPVIVLDEPTTGLDVVSQDKVLCELLRLRDEQQVAMIYVTHDLAVVAQIADRIAVMYAGRIVEEGPVLDILRRPRHPYTRGLLASIPDHVAPCVLEPMPGIAVGVGERPAGCAFAPRCTQTTQACRLEMPPLEAVGNVQTVRCLHWEQTPPVKNARSRLEHRASTSHTPLLAVQELTIEHRSRQETVIAARDVSFTVARGACVALVGESGSGKTTLARAIAGLHPPAAGRIVLDDRELPSQARRRTVQQRQRIQLVSQNPADALNPRRTVAETVARPARILRGLDRAAARRVVDELLEQVRLPANLAQRYPAELSGGERQRVALARALAAQPDLIICDEITSALDVSVQAAVLTLLSQLRADLDLAQLIITHDLGLVATIADELLVLEHGVIRERGPTATVLHAPQHSYTKRLLDAAPSVTAAVSGRTTPYTHHTTKQRREKDEPALGNRPDDPDAGDTPIRRMSESLRGNGE
jgi:peptide/nickel transport system ATP-binding protein